MVELAEKRPVRLDWTGLDTTRVDTSGHDVTAVPCTLYRVPWSVTSGHDVARRGLRPARLEEREDELDAQGTGCGVQREDELDAQELPHERTVARVSPAALVPTWPWPVRRPCSAVPCTLYPVPSSVRRRVGAGVLHCSPSTRCISRISHQRRRQRCRACSSQKLEVSIISALPVPCALGTGYRECILSALPGSALPISALPCTLYPVPCTSAQPGSALPILRARDEDEDAERCSPLGTPLLGSRRAELACHAGGTAVEQEEELR